MEFSVKIGEVLFRVDLEAGVDLSIALTGSRDQVNCFYAPPLKFEPVRSGNFVGSTALGGAVNFFNIQINPHGNGTHTECVGHISQEPWILADCLRLSHFPARLISVLPEQTASGDRVITISSLGEFVPIEEAAVVIRTLPNEESRSTKNYSGTNPPYFSVEAMRWLVSCGVKHLLTDLPSVDREEDGGKLLAHKEFWGYPEALRLDCTITELIYVPQGVPDGVYFLNLQTLPFRLDVSPSRPVLYPLLIS
jgi:kynurenine formamidase